MNVFISFQRQKNRAEGIIHYKFDAIKSDPNEIENNK